MTFTLGCDPEVFVKKNGVPISAYGLIPGTKKAPHKTSHGAVQVDGMALEFNTNPVNINDFEAFNTNIVKTKRDLKTFLGNDYNLSEVPVMEFDKAYIDAQPEEAKELGCDPDYCAYTLKPNPRPDGDRGFRTGAGHIHFGWGADIPVNNEDHIKICADFVKTLDATVGLFMTFIDRDPRRRELYGKAGAFRPKPYGVEYRTPSNVWIRNKARRLIIHNLCNRAVEWQRNGRPVTEMYGLADDFDFAACINNGEANVAKNLLDIRLNRGTNDIRTAWEAVKVEMETEESDNVKD